jgi:hypothetical protein
MRSKGKRAAVFGFILLLTVACKSGPDEPATTKPAPSASVSAASVTPPPTAEQRAFVNAMNDFCIITQQVNGDASIEPAKRPLQIVKRLVAKSPPAEFLDMLRSLGDLPSDERYTALQRAAATRGAPHWSCPALAE